MDKATTKYLLHLRREYIRICFLDEDRVISEMQGGRNYLMHYLEIHFKEKNLDGELVKKTMEEFGKIEPELVRK